MPVEFHWLFAAVIPLVLFVGCVVFLWWSERKFEGSRRVERRKPVQIHVDWASLSAYLGVEVRSVEDLKRITRKTQ